MIGRGVVVRSFVQDLLRSLGRVDFSGGLFESLLVPAQVGHADLEQLVQRQVDHFFVQKFLAKAVGAQAKVAAGPRQQVILQEGLIALQRVHDQIVRLLEFGQQRRVLHFLERGRVRPFGRN